MSSKHRESNRLRTRTTPLFTSLLVTLLLALLFAPSAFATPKAEQKAAIAKLKVQADKIYMQISAANEDLNAANERYAAVKSAIDENTKVLAVAKFNLAAADQSMQSRVVALYKQQEVDFLDVLLSTKSFDELVGHMDAMKTLNANDFSTVKSIEKLKTEISDRAVKLGADKKAAKAIVDEQAQKLAARKVIEAKVARLIAGHEAQLQAIQDKEAQAAQDAADAADALDTDTGTGPVGVSHGAVVTEAIKWLGVPYVYGGSSPSGFDCSGLTMYCYATVGISLYHNAAEQQRSVTAISADQLQDGDLVFFGSPAYHVGIYAGGGQMIHAPHTGTVVQYGSISGASSYGRP